MEWIARSFQGEDGGLPASQSHVDVGEDRIGIPSSAFEAIAGSVPPIANATADLDDEIKEAMSDEADRRLGIRQPIL